MADMRPEYLNAAAHLTDNESIADQFISETLSSLDEDTLSVRSAIFLNRDDKIVGNRFRKVDPDSRESFLQVVPSAKNMKNSALDDPLIPETDSEAGSVRASKE